jgi:hypothetical protein
VGYLLFFHRIPEIVQIDKKVFCKELQSGCLPRVESRYFYGKLSEGAIVTDTVIDPFGLNYFQAAR